MDDELEDLDIEEGAPEWIVTFADMMSLLLTFFILLLSFAKTDVEKFKAAANSLNEAFTFTAMPIPGKAKPLSASPIDLKSPLPQSNQTGNLSLEDQLVQREANQLARLTEIKNYVDNYISREQLDMFIKTKLSDNGLAIVNSDPLSFPAGKADLSSNSVRYLDALLPALAETEFKLIIEGHTDDRPINTAEFTSNWELSTARASRFARYLIDRGVAPNRMSVRGYAEFHPVAPNDNEENRARNRRIEILLKYDNSDSEQSEFSEL